LQIGAIRKTTRDTYDINALRQFAFFVPHHRDIGARLLERNRKIAITVRSGKYDNSCTHQAISTV
jgi:hypothetical protein